MTEKVLDKELPTLAQVLFAGVLTERVKLNMRSVLACSNGHVWAQDQSIESGPK